MTDYKCTCAFPCGGTNCGPQSAEAYINSLQAQLDAMRAQCERLRNVIVEATNSGAQLDSGKWVYSIDDSVLSETPEQSLAEIEARAIERLAEDHCSLWPQSTFKYRWIVSKAARLRQQANTQADKE